MKLIITKHNLGLWAASYIRARWAAREKDPFVLGLPTGGTVVDMYAALSGLVKNGKMSFKNIVTFNMDEYVGLPPEHDQSYHYYMKHNLFDHVDIVPQNAHILNGQATDLHAECDAYEAAIKQAGGVDLFLGGVGRNGHLAFNEPGSSFDSRTRVMELTESTKQANSRFFGNDPAQVPSSALTVGIGTVLDSKELLFLAMGRSRLGWLFKEMEKFRQKTAHLSLLRVPGREWVGKKGVYDMDLSKILIYTGNTGKSGAWLGEKLRREYHLELEMCAPQYGLALTSLWDREEGLERLYQAVTEIDSELASEASVPGRADNPLYDRGSIYDDMTFHMKAAYSIFQAQEMPAEEVLLSACSGRAAAEYVYLYPPGIPCLVPGEVITDEMVQKILRYEKMGFSVQGLKNNGNYRLKVLCTKEKKEREL